MSDATPTPAAAELKGGCPDTDSIKGPTDPNPRNSFTYPAVADIEKDTIHQIWIQGEKHLKDTKPGFYQNVQGFREAHPGKHHLWSEEEIMSLLIGDYPDLIKTFESYDHYILKVHLAKYVILHHYGGFYVDVDTKMQRKFKGLINICSRWGNKPLVCCTDDKSSYKTKMYNTIGKEFIDNHFFYFPEAGNEFCQMLMDDASLQTGRMMLEPRAFYVHRVIGPGYVMRCIKKFQSKLSEKFEGIRIERASFLTTLESAYLDRFFSHQAESTWLEGQGPDRMRCSITDAVFDPRCSIAEAFVDSFE